VDNTIAEGASAANTAGHTSKFTKTSLPTDTNTLGKNNSLDDAETW
jgi:hypothetical protein